MPQAPLLIRGKDCIIYLTIRPHYCDRGNFLAQIDARGKLGTELDWADGWPRYYFDIDRAKAEIEAWLKKRNQWIADSHWKEDSNDPNP